MGNYSYKKAAYGSKNPIYAVKQRTIKKLHYHPFLFSIRIIIIIFIDVLCPFADAQSAMRAAIGELELDQILHARARLNSIIKESLQVIYMYISINIYVYSLHILYCKNTNSLMYTMLYLYREIIKERGRSLGSRY